MTYSYDVFAEINPAYCLTVLAPFCIAYAQQHRSELPPSVALVYVALPIALSEDLSQSFDGCNKSTGLFAWLSRSPGICDELGKRVNATLAITTTAIRFGCVAGKLRLTKEGELASLLDRVPAAVSSGVAAPAVRRARMLGTWTAAAGSPRAVLEAFGVRV